MRVICIRYTGKTKQWAIIAPWLTNGAIVTKDEKQAATLAALHVRNWGTGPRDGWDYDTGSQTEFNALIAQAKVEHEQYKATVGGGAGGQVDLSPVLTAIAQVPTAQQNGQAARAAIVK